MAVILPEMPALLVSLCIRVAKYCCDITHLIVDPD
jgi:hypothetical protein